MELDFRKLIVTKLFDFSKDEEKLIIEMFDQLSEIYSISVTDIKNSPYDQFNSGDPDLLKTPKICYYITNEDKTNTFYLFIMNTIGISGKGARTTDKYDSLEIWGLKKLNEDFGFISVNRKKLADKIAGIFSQFNVNFKENRDFKDFYVLGSDSFKTMAFLTPQRKEIIKSFPDEDFKLEVKSDILGFGLPKTLNVNNALIISKFLNDI
ncbi:hypothetical protein F3J23_05895 [Chryseobacterium sp. Tr-659]|uniref:hypothetical protein n=1 Tax=Chryseobacterium sp. Tr-659 TaxID=2608340 RepID=UPI0014214FCC|nr:hypothetical protein [Chryseobacterium sp. Tr-659]NIF04969.1 hypothetical protein [Chryseobacterium sp. Tr-659]